MDEGFFNLVRATEAGYLVQRQGFVQPETTGAQPAQFRQIGTSPQGTPQIGGQRANIRSRRAMDSHT